MNRRPAPAKINLALVVGPLREDGKHEVVSVMQRLDLSDRVRVERSGALHVDGYDGDTIVRRALEELGGGYAATIDKRIPVAAGLGGGSSDAATALVLANGLRDDPLPHDDLHAIARELGSDVPFFLRQGPQLATGDGTDLVPLDLPQDYWVVLVLPRGARKASTGAVYEQFDARSGADGYEERRASLLAALERVRRPRDLALLPRNDLAGSPVAGELLEHGAFRADVTGAGPAVYGLFLHKPPAEAAERALRRHGRTWLAAPSWYG
jgi:4-diphosphocytidyl-2-C-methyl-D-erythritol kinase